MLFIQTEKNLNLFPVPDSLLSLRDSTLQKMDMVPDFMEFKSMLNESHFFIGEDPLEK
jgi:hypothetical protein